VIESCTLATVLDRADLESPGRPPPARLYLGSEFCEWRIPSTRDLDAVLDRGIPLTVVTPVVTRHGLAAVSRLLSHLEARAPGTELVANDFGVLEAARASGGVTTVLGRLLTRNVIFQVRNRLQVPSFDPLLMMRDTFGVTRFEVSAFRTRVLPPANGWPFDLHLTMYHPWVWLMTTRKCLFRFRRQEAEGRFDERIDRLGCDRSCGEDVFRFEYPGVLTGTRYYKGNTMFMRYDDLSYSDADYAALRVDRLVECPEPPV
jgi:hypothetical protein